MQTIVVNSQKGGSGKTMLCKHLAVEAERTGAHTFLIDTDPQGTLTAWHAKREAELPALVDLPFEAMEAGLALLAKNGAAYCIIDSGSGRLDKAEELFRLADLVVFPVQPSEDDLTAVPVTAGLLKKHGTPFLFVLNRVKPNTLITGQAAAILSKHGQVAETFVTDRTPYKSPFRGGQLVTEAAPKGPEAREITHLWEDITACLHESMPTTEETRQHG